MISEPTALLNADTGDVSDHQLLSDFLNGSERAFDSLVRRHIDAVYSSALRQVSDPHTAADVTSAVFIILARKAGSLRREAIIPAWLHRTTRFTALKAVRARMRRQHHEQEAARMQHPSPSDEPHAVWEEIAPFLDEGLAHLPTKDHEAVVLRFFQNKTFPEIGVLTGSTAEGARKRVDRAVEKLKHFLTRRGVVVPTTALAAAIMANGVQASPLGLTVSVTAAGAGASVAPLVALALRALRWRLFLKMAGAFAAAVIGAMALFQAWELASTVPAASPLQAFRRLTDATRDGDGDAWSSLIHVAGPEERRVRSLMASNIVAQAGLRRELIANFGESQYASSGFPRVFDDTPESQLAAAVESIAGDQAVVTLPRGSKLRFVREGRGWKFDFFRTTPFPVSSMGASAGTGLVKLKAVSAALSRGGYLSVEDALADYQSDNSRGGQAK